MKPQFNNSVLASFLFWAEHELGNKGEAYINYTSKLYYNPDLRLGTGYVTYSSPFKQWVYDQGLTGAHICSGISGSITLSNNQSGLKVDYENGRVILPASFGTGLNISGSYAFKELNTYRSNETEETLISDSKYYLNGRFSGAPTGPIPPYDMVNPAMFINLLNNSNDPFAFGGLDDTKINLSIVAMTESMYQLDSLFSIFVDSKLKCFPQLSIYEDPLDEFGNVKTGLYPSGYNYNSVVAQKGTPGNLIYIDNVTVSKVSDRINVDNRIFVGFMDFEVSKVRTPRQ